MSFWDFLVSYWPRLLSGTIVTIEIFFLASALAIAIAVVCGLMKLSSNPIVRWTSIIYVETFRGTSLIVQLYWIYFVLPLFGLMLEKFSAGFIAVGMNLGAYGAELVRGAVQAVPKGQWEAAYALSMSPAKRMWRIIFPQALVIMLPPWGNLLIELLKYSALVALIGVTDLMFQTKQINSSTLLSAQAFGAAIIIYYILARILLTPGLRWIEARIQRKLQRS